MFHKTLYVPVAGVTFPQDEEHCCAAKTTKCEFVREDGTAGAVNIKRAEDVGKVGQKRKRGLAQGCRRGRKLGQGTLTYAELKSAIAELWQRNETFTSENARLRALNERLLRDLSNYRASLAGVSRENAALRDIVEKN